MIKFKCEANMNRKVFIALIVILLGASAGMAMVGGPVFTIGKQITSMTVAASQVEMAVPMTATGTERENMVSRRIFLIGRFGLENFADMDVKLGAADLTYNDLGQGFSEYSSSPALAWGTGLRAGFPEDEAYQVTGSLSYLGYHADATSERGSKSINSKYLWQEVTPSITVGYKFGNLVPYAGVLKPFLFGTRDYTVSFNGQPVASATGKDSYTDGEQELRGLMGLEWHMPDGYSISGEASTTSSGTWTLSIGLAQALK
jgi:hypothetical protein